jgi:hypothetical protein
LQVDESKHCDNQAESGGPTQFPGQAMSVTTPGLQTALQAPGQQGVLFDALFQFLLAQADHMFDFVFHFYLL